MLTDAGLLKYLATIEDGCVRALRHAGAWDYSKNDIRPSAIIPRNKSARGKARGVAAALQYLYHLAMCLHAARRLRTLLADRGKSSDIAKAALLLAESWAEAKGAPTGARLEKILREHRQLERSAQAYREALIERTNSKGRSIVHAYEIVARRYSLTPPKSEAAMRTQVKKLKNLGYLRKREQH